MQLYIYNDSGAYFFTFLLKMSATHRKTTSCKSKQTARELTCLLFPQILTAMAQKLRTAARRAAFSATFAR